MSHPSGSKPLLPEEGQRERCRATQRSIVLSPAAVVRPRPGGAQHGLLATWRRGHSQSTVLRTRLAVYGKRRQPRRPMFRPMPAASP